MDPPPAWRSAADQDQYQDGVASNSMPAGEDDIPPPDYPSYDVDLPSTLGIASSTSSRAAALPNSDLIHVKAARVAGLSPESFFDIAPRSDATSFQVGYLGMPGFKAWIQGDVLVKITPNSTERRRRFWKCTIDLSAVESINSPTTSTSASSSSLSPDPASSMQIELFSSTQTLWDASAAATSASGSANASLPASMPFSFELTPDLPHCIHLSRSQLAYKLTATLHGDYAESVDGDGQEVADAVKVVPVHLTRYTPPGELWDLLADDLDDDLLNSQSTARQSNASYLSSATHSFMASLSREFSLSPYAWSISTPIVAHVQLPRGTIYRRAQPIDLRVVVPPPSREKHVGLDGSGHGPGVQLRAVEAELVRRIWVLPRGSTERDDPQRVEILQGIVADTDQEKERKAVMGKGKLAEDASFAGPTWRSDCGTDVPDYAHGEGPSMMSIPAYHFQQYHDAPPPFVDHQTQTESSSHVSPQAQSTPPPLLPSQAASRPTSSPRAYESILAYSGKLCRFHSQKPIILRLALHPPFDSVNMPHPHPDHDAASLGRGFGFGIGVDSGGGVSGGLGVEGTRARTRTGTEGSAAGDTGASAGFAGVPAGSGCESISQETVLHRVDFEVRVRIALQRSAEGRYNHAGADPAAGTPGFGLGTSASTGMSGSRSGGGSGQNASERRDIRLHKRVYILPGAAGKVVQFENGENGISAKHGEGATTVGSINSVLHLEQGESLLQVQGLTSSTLAADPADAPLASPCAPSCSPASFSVSEEKNGRQAAAEAEASQGVFVNFDAQEEFDGYEDVARSFSPPPPLEGLDEESSVGSPHVVHYLAANVGAGSDGATSNGPATLLGTTEEEQGHHHSLNLEQLMHFLEGGQMLGGSQEELPPPTLQESRNDFQFEVPVEGVGMAMPRDLVDRSVLAYTTGHNYQHRGDGAHGLHHNNDDDEDVYDPPPPMSPLAPGTPHDDIAILGDHDEAIHGLAFALPALDSYPESNANHLALLPLTGRGHPSGIAHTHDGAHAAVHADADPPSFGDATGQRAQHMDGLPSGDEAARAIVTQPPPYRGRTPTLLDGHPSIPVPLHGAQTPVQPAMLSPVVNGVPPDHHPPAYAHQSIGEAGIGPSELPDYEEQAR
ncbi:hypothetical protein K437DRAFT_104425 [Tilletiaria anomala UBC 951]|uniref:Uncharacterized protein n=1 Tax=Tilletiaria anomala (strain ATCC 24038 / CBS 436.72 / UBC 951) TaxID=1037660 RepID=A0A066VYI6_TILAU|nr:uncharacterized protein K437DRAFT_104425 [Tilletiaria anomala UBC 951]KDN46797.1 hypothetical protein K437DRAFT_104425 [Tilletiaria anomala UBC 951]